MARIPSARFRRKPTAGERIIADLRDLNRKLARGEKIPCTTLRRVGDEFEQVQGYLKARKRK